MRHPSDGTLRRILDEPAGVADPVREHVAGCPQCLAGLASAQEDAAFAATALGGEVPTDVDEAWHRLSGVVAVEGRRRVAPAARTPRWRAALRRPAVTAFGVVVLVTGAGAAAAAGWVPIFRTEQVAPVSVTEADLVALPDLSAFGEVEVVSEPDVRQVPDAAAAEQETGLSLPRVGALPQGVSAEPVFQVGGQVRAVFTFSAEKAAQAASAAGETLPPPPPGLDGSQFQLLAGPGAAEVWPSSSGAPALVVARAVAPTASSSGIPFSTARDYLLSLPGLPENLASQLRSFSGDGTTLPLPVPAEQVTATATNIGGMPGTLLATKDGTLAGVVWVDDGTVTAVAGSLSADEVLSVARGLR
jgi:hypothetical protein